MPVLLSYIGKGAPYLVVKCLWRSLTAWLLPVRGVHLRVPVAKPPEWNKRILLFGWHRKSRTKGEPSEKSVNKAPLPTSFWEDQVIGSHCWRYVGTVQQVMGPENNEIMLGAHQLSCWPSRQICFFGNALKRKTLPHHIFLLSYLLKAKFIPQTYGHST